MLPSEERAMSLGVVMVKKSELELEYSGCFIFTLSLSRCVKGMDACHRRPHGGMLWWGCGFIAGLSHCKENLSE